jgi:hypothetical protein
MSKPANPLALEKVLCCGLVLLLKTHLNGFAVRSKNHELRNQLVSFIGYLT